MAEDMVSLQESIRQHEAAIEVLKQRIIIARSASDKRYVDRLNKKKPGLPDDWPGDGITHGFGTMQRNEDGFWDMQELTAGKPAQR